MKKVDAYDDEELDKVFGAAQAIAGDTYALP